MKSRIFLSIVQLTFFMFRVMAQTETFDIVHYTPPKDWKKQESAGAVTYVHSNESTGAFCVIAIYNSAASLGTAKKDFMKEWKDRIVPLYKAKPNPSTEEQSTPDGWKSTTGAAPIKIKSANAIIVATVFTGFGKRISILATLNDQSYLSAVDTFLQNMTLDKTPNVSSNTSFPPQQIIPNAGQEKFQKVIYITPAGWKKETYTDGILLKAANLPQGELLLIQLMLPISAGSLDEALAKTYDEACVGLTATQMREVDGTRYSKLQIKKSFKCWEYIRCSGGIKMGSNEYPPEYGLDVFVAKINDRFERMYILKSRNNCNLSRYYPSERLNYYNDIERFIFSLQFTDWKEPEIKPGFLSGEGIVGVWQGIAMRVGAPAPGAQVGATLKAASAIFFSNGQAYFGTNFPSEGLDEFNTWIAAETNRRDWGTYSFSNGKGILKLPYGEIPLRMENSKLIISPNKTEHTYVKVNVVDGVKFSGTYLMNNSALNKVVSLQFSADGKFKDDGVISILLHTYYSCINPALQIGSGAYAIKNHSVIFNYNDGRKIKIALIGLGFDSKDQSPATLNLSFNSDVLTKR